jgi:hypothetical protein
MGTIAAQVPKRGEYKTRFDLVELATRDGQAFCPIFTKIVHKKNLANKNQFSYN